jgi:Zinc finger, C2H2 type
VATPPYSFTEQSATPHALIQPSFASSAYPNIDTENLGERPLLAAQHAESALQGTLEHLQQVDTGNIHPFGHFLQQAGPQDHFLGLLGSQPGRFHENNYISGPDYTTGDVQVPLFTVHHCQAPSSWHGASSILDPYGEGALDSMIPGSYQPETGLSFSSNVAGMNAALDQRFLSFSDPASTYGDWTYNDIDHDYGSLWGVHGRITGQIYPPVGLASLASSDDPFGNTITEPQDLEADSVLGEASPTSSLSASEVRSTDCGPSRQNPSSRPAPGSPEKSRKAWKPHSKCARCDITFSRPSDLDRHMDAIHHRRRPQCSVPGCTNNKGEGFSRPDKFREHMRKQHPGGTA